MENVEAWIENDDQGEVLMIKVRLGCCVGYSKAKRNAVIGTSRGNQSVPSLDGRLRPEKFNITCFRPLTSKEKFTRELYPKWPDASNDE